MGTYIIHFDDKPWQDLDDEQYYRCKEIPWFSTTKTTISRLTPYTEDSAYAHGYTEAESKYREIRDELEKQAYQRGLNDAWKCARKINCLPSSGGIENYVLGKIFGHTSNPIIMEKFSASEAIKKIRQYEQEKEEQIQVGDEVISPNGKGVVTEITDIYVRIMYAKGSGQVFKPEDLTKTGRHFPEIAEVLAKMKESDNG